MRRTRIRLDHRPLLAMSDSCRLSAGAAQLAAHHGWTGYRGRRKRQLTGTIKTFSYENPHGQLDLDVDGKRLDGRARAAERECSRGGCERGMLKVGSQATVLRLHSPDVADRAPRRAHYHRRQDHRVALAPTHDRASTAAATPCRGGDSRRAISATSRSSSSSRFFSSGRRRNITDAFRHSRLGIPG